MVGVGRDLWGSSSLTSLPKQGHLEQAAPDLIQAGFEYLQSRRLHNPYGQPVPVLSHPQHELHIAPVTLSMSTTTMLPGHFQVYGAGWDPLKSSERAGEELAKTLSIIYEQSCLTGEVPDDWRIANVTPIYKMGQQKILGTTGLSA